MNLLNFYSQKSDTHNNFFNSFRTLSGIFQYFLSFHKFNEEISNTSPLKSPFKTISIYPSLSLSAPNSTNKTGGGGWFCILMRWVSHGSFPVFWLHDTKTRVFCKKTDKYLLSYCNCFNNKKVFPFSSHVFTLLPFRRK